MGTVKAEGAESREQRAGEVNSSKLKAERERGRLNR
jgi:hypothetical protein